MKGNGKKSQLKPTARELRLAGAIGQAVQESLGPKIDATNARLDATIVRLDAGFRGHGAKLDQIHETLTTHGRKLDQLVSGAVGVGRIVSLEQRVTELERQR